MERTPKSDKELAVDVVIAYIESWFPRAQKPLTGSDIKLLIQDTYAAIHELKE